MANRSTSGYYIRNSYRRKRWRTVLIVSAILIVALFVAFLVIGNILSKKTESDVSEETERPVHTHQTTKPPYQLVSPSYNVSVKGKALALDTANIKDTAAAFYNDGYTSISLNLSDKDGNLLFESSVAQKFGYPSASSVIDLTSLDGKISSAGPRTSAVISLNSFSEDDPITRSVLRACEAAIVCEIASAGIDDTLIRYPDIAPEHTDELISLAEQVKSIDPNAVVGLVLTPEFLDGDNSSILVEKIVSSFDFIAMDITDISDDGDISEQIEEILSTDKYYYILRYNVRVLLPDVTDEAEAKEIYALMDSNNITNWQTVS